MALRPVSRAGASLAFGVSPTKSEVSDHDLSLTRKRPEDKSERWRPRRSVRRYLDDVDEILSTVKDIGQVTVDTGDFSGAVANGNELRIVDTPTLDELTISVESEERTLTVNVAPRVEMTLAPRDNLLLQGASQKIRTTLEARMLPFGAFSGGRAWVENPFAGIIGVVGPVATLIGLSLVIGLELERAANPADVDLETPATAPSLDGWVTLVVLGLLSFLAASAFGIWARFGRNSDPSGVLVVAYKDEAPSFWRQNQTAIGIGLATNIAVGFLFFFLGLLAAG